MVDGLAMGRFIPPVSPTGRIKGVSPEQGRSGDRNQDRKQDKGPEGGSGNENTDQDNADRGEDISQGSRIDICI